MFFHKMYELEYVQIAVRSGWNFFIYCGDIFAPHEESSIWIRMDGWIEIVQMQVICEGYG